MIARHGRAAGLAILAMTAAGAPAAEPKAPPPDAVRKIATPDQFVDRLGFAYYDRILASSANGCARLWNVREGSMLREDQAPALVHKALAVSGDSRCVAQVLSDDRIQVLNLQTGERKISGYANNGAAIALSHDGTYVAGCAGQSLYIYEVATGKPAKTFPEIVDTLSGVAFLPGDTQVVAAAFKSRHPYSLHLVDLKTERVVYRGAQSFNVQCLALSPDGKTLAAPRNFQHEVPLLDLPEMQPRALLKGHTEYVIEVAYSPDGKWLLSGAFDQTARLWEVETGQCVRVYDGFGYPRALAFAQNGKTMAMGGSGRVIILRDLVPPVSSEPLDFAADYGDEKWLDLCRTDAVAAYDCMRLMVYYGDSVVPLIESRVRGAFLEREVQVALAIERLGSEEYDERRQAADFLVLMRSLIETQLRVTLKTHTSLIAKAHLAAILKKTGEVPNVTLGLNRSLQVLEWLATPSALELLEVIAHHDSASAYSQEAGRALIRISARRLAEQQPAPKW